MSLSSVRLLQGVRGRRKTAWLTNEEIKSCRAEVFEGAMKFYGLATLLALHGGQRRRAARRCWVLEKK